jgi:hypothetical protein
MKPGQGNNQVLRDSTKAGPKNMSHSQATLKSGNISSKQVNDLSKLIKPEPISRPSFQDSSDQDDSYDSESRGSRS